MNYHLYADDTQIYALFTYDDPEDMLAAKLGIERCLNDIYCWMSNNKLKLNKDKTELPIFYSKFRKQPSFPPLVVGEELIPRQTQLRILVPSWIKSCPCLHR